MNSNSIKYRRDIDGIRGLSVLLVLFFHYFPNIVHSGYIGVDVFFVISGYLITLNILDKRKNKKFLLYFFQQRIKRIFPALLLVIFSCLLATYIFMPGELRLVGKSIKYIAFFFYNFLLSEEFSYFGVENENNVFLNFWSLSVEEQFYIFWPFLFLFLRKNNQLLFFLITITFLSLSFSIYHGYFSPIKGFYFITYFRIWELTLGAIFAIVSLEKETLFHKIRVLNSIMPEIGIIMILGIAFFPIQGSEYPGWYALIPCIGTILILVEKEKFFFSKILKNRILVFTGLISYPLYLWHWPVLYFSRIFWEKELRGVQKLEGIVFSFFLAVLTYIFLEKPIRYSNRHNLLKVVVMILLMITLFFTGNILEKHKNFYKIGVVDHYEKINKEGSCLLKNERKRIRFFSDPSFFYDHKDIYKNGTCLLEEDTDKTFFSLCPRRKTEKKSILIWGDSHAAHLIRGYEEVFGDKYEIIQRTVTVCPPLLGEYKGLLLERSNCKNMNKKIIDLIREEKPDQVVLAASWYIYDFEAIALEKTIEALLQAGIKSIRVVGNVPRWKLPLPILISSRDKNFSFYNKYTKEELEDLTILNKKIRLISQKYGPSVRFIPIRDYFCNKKGCLLYILREKNILPSWDYDHLTGEGSVYAVSRFPEPFS